MDMWNLAADLGLAVVERRVAHRSGYWAEEEVIYLTPDMPPRTLRCVLAHEIAHHVLAHRPAAHGPVRARQERAANEWAAKRLIDPERYAEVERQREGHLASMAHDLNVVPEFVQVFQGLLLRVGDTVYVSPRMGVGGYEARMDVA